MKKRSVIALFVAILLLSACGIINPPTGGATSPPPTPDLGKPEGAALAFLDAWAKKDYTGMYSLLSMNSQKSFTLDEFTNIYTGAERAMTMRGLTTTAISVLPGTDMSAQFSFHVTYDTVVLGPIDRDLTMQMILMDDQWRIVWSPSLIFAELANGATLQLEVQSPSRANIYDRNGSAFVTENASTVTISAVPGEISTTSEDSMLALLSRVLRVPASVIKNNYAGFPPDSRVAIGDADDEVVQANWSSLQSYPGLYFDPKTSRRTYNALAPHVMGYTSYIPEAELETYRAQGYQDDAIVGIIGLEKWGEPYLAGTRGGTLSAYDLSGAFIGEIASRESQPAQSLYTTLDRGFQQSVQDILANAYQAGTNTWAPKAGGAAVIVLDVNTGNILAMASYPDFDPNILNPRNNNPLGTQGAIQTLIDSPFKPFLNRATQGRYPAGSVFKIVTATAAYESGTLTPDSSLNCLGYWDGLGADNRRYDWKEDGHGTLSFAKGLTASCDPWFYQAGYLTGLKDHNIIPDTARQFGYGQILGNQLEEDQGLIPDPEWMQSERGEAWTSADDVNIAIGQGDVVVTPLQVVTMMSAIANGGTVYRPHFVDHIGLIGEEPSVTYQPEVITRVGITPEHLKTIQESLRNVIIDADYGTGWRRLADMQIPVAGKTGTAQVSGATAPPIAWFVGYAPYDNPEIAVVVMVENGGEGSGVAAPIWRRVVETYFDVPVRDWPPDWFDPDLFEFVDNDFGGE